jgi:hypothetical protein
LTKNLINAKNRHLLDSFIRNVELAKPYNLALTEKFKGFKDKIDKVEK